MSRDIVVKHDAPLPADRHKLPLWIPGTRLPGAQEPEPRHVVRGGSHEFCKLAATLGYRGTKVDSLTAHGTMISGKNRELFGKVWRYLLTQ